MALYPPGVQPDRWEIEIYDRSAVRKSFFVSGAIHGCIDSFEFTTHKNGGCADFTMVCHKDRVQNTVQRGYIIKIWITYPGSPTKLQVYTGQITHTPVYSTGALVTYRGYGLWHQARAQLISKYYAGKDIDDMVKDILTVIRTPNSDISSSVAEISVAAPYTIGDFEGEWVTAADALMTLAMAQGSIQYGVNQEGKLYFKDLSTTIGDAKFVEGMHFSDAYIYETSDRAINRVYLRSKEMVGGGLLVNNRDDAASSTSITNIGLRTALLDIPHLKTHADIWRYAQNYLAAHGAREQATIKLGPFLDYFFPRSDAYMIDKDGVFIASLPIQSVTYRMTRDQGFYGEMTVGDDPPINFEREVFEMIRDGQRNKSAHISSTKIEHTRAEEWRQTVITDAQKNGNLNQFTDTFSDEKALDVSQCRKLYIDTQRAYVGADQDNPTGAIIMSNIIPSGEVRGIIRVHLDVNIDGRIDFHRDADLRDFHTQYANWQLDANIDGRAENTVDSFLELKQTAYRPYPTTYTIRFALDNVDAGPHVYKFCWNRLDTNNYHFIEFTQNAGGGGTHDVRLRQMIAGTPITRAGPWNGTNRQALMLKLIARNNPTNTQLLIYDKATEVLQTTLTSSAYSQTSGYKVGCDAWFNAFSTPCALLDWIEPDLDDSSIAVHVSRDGGTTWTSAGIIPDGESNNNVNVGAQPAGSSIMLRATMNWPSRLYGWGVSF